MPEISPISSRNSVPPSASSKRPLRCASAPVNAPFSWPNSSELQHAFRQGGAVQLDERLVLARRCIVQGLSEQLLAGAGLATQQHGGVAARDQLKLSHNRLQHRTFTDDAGQPASARGRGKLLQLLFHPALIFQDALPVADHQPVQPDGLADQVRDHLQEPDILIGPHIGDVDPDCDQSSIAPIVLSRSRIGTPMKA